MIKSIKIKNSSSFLEEQELIFFNSYNEKTKNINYIFGLSGTGKSSLFQILKATILYMRKWILFSSEDSLFTINKNLNLKNFFNPNIDFQGHESNNFSFIELIFAIDDCEYKYELSFNDKTCNYERFSYYPQSNNNEWISIFSKNLISYSFINGETTSFFKTSVNSKELGLDFELSLKELNLNNSIFSYVTSFDQLKKFKKLNDIIANIIFFDEKNFQNLNSFIFPTSFVLENKKKILSLLQLLEINFSDISVNSVNKLSGFYELNLYLNKTTQHSDNPKFISSSRLSKEELKVLIFAFIFCKYENQNKVIIIDKFTSMLNYSTFLNIQKKLESLIQKKFNCSTQIISFNRHFFNKTKKRGLDNFNIFNIVKNKINHSFIYKVTHEQLMKEEMDNLNNLKLMLNIKNSEETEENLSKNYEKKFPGNSISNNESLNSKDSTFTENTDYNNFVYQNDKNSPNYENQSNNQKIRNESSLNYGNYKNKVKNKTHLDVGNIVQSGSAINLIHSKDKSQKTPNPDIFQELDDTKNSQNSTATLDDATLWSSLKENKEAEKRAHDFYKNFIVKKD